MIDLDWRVHETDGPALVAAFVQSAHPTPRRIALEPRTDGEVLPPRRRGLPERGWSDGEFSGVVPAEGRLSLGFASTGPLDDPPVAVTDGGRAPVDGVETGGPTDAEPTEVLRDLGSPLPPRDALPDGSVEPASGLDGPDEPSGPAASSSAVGEGIHPSRRRVAELSDETGRAAGRHGSQESRPVDVAVIPCSVADWLDDVSTRVDRAERLAKGRDLDEATTAVDAVGGLAGVERLVDALEADESALRTVAERTTELADACGCREEVPVDAYRELA